MTQKQFIKQLMSRGVSHSDACGLVAYMKELRQLIEKHEDVVMLADANTMQFVPAKVFLRGNLPTDAGREGHFLLKTMKIVLYGDPRTKKNSARILKAHANRRIVAPSEAFMQYQEKCLWQIKRPYNPITARVNVRCVYYMATRRKVDLANLIEATCDILVKAKVLADDNSQIVAAHDGSRVDYDKKNPRAEIWIEEMEDENG